MALTIHAAPVEERVAERLSRMSLEEKLSEQRSGLAALRPFLTDSTGRPWPNPIALAATWDREVVRELHGAIGALARSQGSRLAVTPSLDLARDPRLGRIERTFGADPYLSAEMGVAAVSGLRWTGVAAAIAGFAGPGSPRPGAHVNPVPISERELREAYLPPFEAAIRRGGAAAVVLARNAIDAVPTHANPWLLRDVLRGEWGFKGAVLGDAGGVNDLKDVYRVAASGPDAATLALASGVDAELEAGPWAAAVDAARLDEAVAALLRLEFTAGLFDDPVATLAIAPPRPLAEMALLAAKRSIVLLKNDGVLPLAGGSPVAVLVTVDVARAEGEVEALKRDGKRVVVVLVGDVPAVSAKLAASADALVAAWGLGELGQQAVKAVLSGEINPGGKLPLTLARNPGQWPIYHDVKPSARRGYLFDTTEPLFPFGWGLGYSTFELGTPRLSQASIDAKGSVRIEVDVRNVGAREGEETVQLYVRGKVSSVARSVKSLKGFERVRVAPGKSRTVTFTLEARNLEGWNEAMQRVLEPGDFEIMTGPDSAHLQSAILAVRGNAP